MGFHTPKDVEGHCKIWLQVVVHNKFFFAIIFFQYLQSLLPEEFTKKNGLDSTFFEKIAAKKKKV